MDDFDWSLLKSFAAVGRHGSLSAAARATASSQPTLSRHISQLEQQIGKRVIERSQDGIHLTPIGADLFQYIEQMTSAADQFSIRVDGQTQSLSGVVRLTASHIIATYVLPPMLTKLRQAEPGIELEMVASDQTENLLRREADIAVRMYQPTQSDLIAKKVGDIPLGAFATQAYIDRRGMPKTIHDLAHHDVIGYDRSTLIIDGFRRAGMDVTRAFFAFRSDNQVVCWQMVLAGYGIGFNQVKIAQDYPDLVRVDTNNELETMPVWLAVHQELHSSPRVRRVFNLLGDALKSYCQ